MGLMNMKKIFFFVWMLFSFVLISACSNASDSNELEADKIYFFYQTTCSHCHDAAKYIKKNYPTLKITALDIKLPGNMKLFEKAVKKYNVTKAAGTPLFCFGKNYIMGWGNEEQNLFDHYVKTYLN